MWRYVKPHGIQIIEFWSEGSSWYKMYSNGWCEQGGTVSWPVSLGNTTQTVLLHKPLQIDYNLLITAASNPYREDNGHIVNEDRSVRTITRFGLTVSDPNGSTKDSYNTWCAMGFLSLEEEKYLKFTKSTTFRFLKGKTYRITIVGGCGGSTAYKFAYGTNYSSTLGGYGGLVTFKATFNETMTTSVDVGTNGVSGGYDAAASWNPPPFVGSSGTATSVVGISAVGGGAFSAPSTPGITWYPYPTLGKTSAPNNANAHGGSTAKPNVIKPISGVTVSVEVNGTAPSNDIKPYCEITII